MSSTGVATAALRSSLCISSTSPSPSDSLQQQLKNPQPSSAQLSAKPQNKSILHKHPLYAPLLHNNVSSQIKEKVLCLEIMGVDSGKALSQNPTLHTASLDSIHAVVSFLHSKGIHHKDFPRIFGMCPQILTSHIPTAISPVFSFINKDLGVPDNQFRRVINKCPRLLTSSVADQLRPCLDYLKGLGFHDLESLAYHDPVLLVSSVENTLVPKLKYIESLGMTAEEAVAVLLRCPTIFTFSIENNLKPKFEYLVGQMGKDGAEEVKEFPQYFAFSLENRIKPRHVEVVEQGLDLSLAVMLKSTDVQFKFLLSEAQAQAQAQTVAESVL
ncbi:unnamed protein product [Linum tenue]|uniref:Uncharacterized protein n=4 Tax=Linum tenue TaxID=586396 RepID=A0AAV0QKG8_9ROSI|nr:unnamed protein product [Linum tenue]